MPSSALACQNAALLAQLDDHRRGSALLQRVRDGHRVGRVQPSRRQAGQDRSLGFVGSEHVDEVKQLIGKLLGGSRVQDHARSGATRSARCRHDRGQWILQLQQHDGCALEVVLGPFHILGREAPVGAGHDDDRVLTVVSNEDHGDPAGAIG